MLRCSALWQVYEGFNKAVFLSEECAERQSAPESIRRVTHSAQTVINEPFRTCLKSLSAA